MSARLDYVLRVGAQHAAAAHRAAPTAGFDDDRPIPREAMDRALKLLNQADLRKYTKHGLKWWEENGATVSDAELYKRFQQVPKEAIKEAQILMDLDLSEVLSPDFAVATLLHRLWEGRYDERGVRIPREDRNMDVENQWHQHVRAQEILYERSRQFVYGDAKYIYPPAMRAVDRFVDNLPLEELRLRARNHFAEYGLQNVTSLMAMISLQLLTMGGREVTATDTQVLGLAQSLLTSLYSIVFDNMENDDECEAALAVRNRVWGVTGDGMEPDSTPTDLNLKLHLLHGGVTFVAFLLAIDSRDLAVARDYPNALGRTVHFRQLIEEERVQRVWRL